MGKGREKRRGEDKREKERETENEKRKAGNVLAYRALGSQHDLVTCDLRWLVAEPLGWLGVCLNPGRQFDSHSNCPGRGWEEGMPD